MRLLDGLPEDEIRRVLAGAHRRRFARREVIFHEGDPADSLHLIDKGRVVVRVTTPLGDTAALDVLGPGDVVGEVALLGPAGVRSATAVALEPSETLAVSAAVFAELRVRHPQTTDVVVAILVARNRELNQRLLEALYVPVEKRVARRLLGVAGHYPAVDEQPVVVPLNQDDLAGLAGTSRESVNRILKRLQAAGAVQVARGAVTLLDTDSLTRLAR